jgi:hypothetical protein
LPEENKYAPTPSVPGPPGGPEPSITNASVAFYPQEAELGKQLTATSVDVRKQITNMRSPAEPFKIMGNLYFVGVAVREYPDDISRNNYINEASVRHTFATFRKVRCRQRAKSNSKKSCRS